MTKAEIEELIKFIDGRITKRAFNEHFHDGEKIVDKGVQVVCKINDLYDLLREYPVEEEKTCGPNYQGMYEVSERELQETKKRLDSAMFDMHNLSIEHAHYVGAVAAMETIFGRKFDPHR